MASLPHLVSACWVLVLVLLAKTEAVELTFELADNARECFYQDIDKGTQVTLEFQVSPATGGGELQCPWTALLLPLWRVQLSSQIDIRNVFS